MSNTLRYGFLCLALMVSIFPATPVLAQQSPLDKLNPNDIPEEERTAWLPNEVVAVLGNQRGRHWGGLGGLVDSADGKRLLSWGQDGVRLWETLTLRELSSVYHRNELVSNLALAPDGRTVAICGFRKTG